MRKIRVYSWICAVTAVLCSLSAISIGFAAWAVTKEDISDSIYGSIGADSFNSNIQGLTISSSVFTMGHYFFEEENASNELVHAETGRLTYTLSFANIDTDCLINSTDMKLKITLNYTNDLAIFSHLDNTYFDYVDENSTAETLNSNSTNSVVIFEKQFNVVSSTTHTITYEFNHTLVTNFASSMNGGSFHLRLEALNE